MSLRGGGEELEYAGKPVTVPERQLIRLSILMINPCSSEPDSGKRVRKNNERNYWNGCGTILHLCIQGKRFVREHCNKYKKNNREKDESLKEKKREIKR